MIKKFFVLLISLLTLLTLLPTFAGNCNYIDMCPTNPNKNNITPTKVIGLNWISEKIAESIIKKELKKETKGNFKVTLKSRGTGDLLKGDFNSLSITGKNLNIGGSHISKFSSNTLCGFNSVKITKDSILFKENMVLNYELEIDNNALKTTLNENGYINSLRNLNLTLNSPLTQKFNIAKVTKADIELRDNKLFYIFQLKTPFISNPIGINISSGIKLKNGKVSLTKFINNNNSLVNTKMLFSILEKTNPLAFTSDIMNNKNSKAYIDSAQIVNNVIHIKGLVLIPKNN